MRKIEPNNLTLATPAPPNGAPAPLPVSRNANLQKRAKAKWITWHLAKELYDLGSNLQKQYKRSMFCGHVIKQTGDKVTSNYCGCRWCIVCNRIRTAKLINKYTAHLEQMEAPAFITCTMPNVIYNTASLGNNISLMNINFRKIFDLCRKYGIKFKGFRKVEVTYNAERKNFHPHVHLISDGQVNLEKLSQVWLNQGFDEKLLQKLLHEYHAGKKTKGEIKGALFIQFWLKRYPKASAAAQDVRPAVAGSLKELFKYSAKLLTRKRTKNKMQQRKINGVLQDDTDIEIQVQALDKIYSALEGKRIIQPIGYTRAELKEFTQLAEGNINADLEAETIDDVAPAENIYQWTGNTWTNIVTGEDLIQYEPGEFEARIITAFTWDTS